MFWRLLLRSIFVKRPQAALAVGSLLVGAAVTSMLLNLYEDVHRKMTQEFRAYGANVVLSPRAADSRDPFRTGGVMDEDVLSRLEAYRSRIPDLAARPLLYVVVRLRRAPGAVPEVEPQNVVAVGTGFSAAGRQVTSLEPKGVAGGPGSGECVVGARVAERLRLGAGDPLEIEPPGPATGSPPQPRRQFRISNVVSTGASEDDQVFLALAELQRLAGFEKKLSLVELRVPGETAAAERAVSELTRAFPGLDVRPVRQIVYSEGRVLGIIRWLVVSLTALILVIIALCIMATMTAIVLERRKDIAVMKALGASPGDGVFPDGRRGAGSRGRTGGLLLRRDIGDRACPPPVWSQAGLGVVGAVPGLDGERPDFRPGDFSPGPNRPEGGARGRA